MFGEHTRLVRDFTSLFSTCTQLRYEVSSTFWIDMAVWNVPRTLTLAKISDGCPKQVKRFELSTCGSKGRINIFIYGSQVLVV